MGQACSLLLGPSLGPEFSTPAPELVGSSPSPAQWLGAPWWGLPCASRQRSPQSADRPQAPLLPGPDGVECGLLLGLPVPLSHQKQPLLPSTSDGPEATEKALSLRQWCPLWRGEEPGWSGA